METIGTRGFTIRLVAMAVSNHPESSTLTDTLVDATKINPKKRARANDSSPQSNEGTIHGVEMKPLDIQTDSQNRRYILFVVLADQVDYF